MHTGIFVIMTRLFSQYFGQLDKVKITGAGDGLGTRLLVLYQDPPQSLCPPFMVWAHETTWRLAVYNYLLQHQIVSSNCDCMHDINHSFIIRPHQRREKHGLGSRLCQLVQHTLEKRRSSASRNGEREESGIRYMIVWHVSKRPWSAPCSLCQPFAQTITKHWVCMGQLMFFKTKYRICNVHSA